MSIYSYAQYKLKQNEDNIVNKSLIPHNLKMCQKCIELGYLCIILKGDTKCQTCIKLRHECIKLDTKYHKINK